MRYVFYVPYLGMEHLRLVRERWKEEHCLFIDGVVAVKMIAPPSISSAYLH